MALLIGAPIEAPHGTQAAARWLMPAWHSEHLIIAMDFLLSGLTPIFRSNTST